MNPQVITFLGNDGGPRVEAEVSVTSDGLRLEARFAPWREPEVSTHETADDLADAIERIVRPHFDGYGGRPLRILVKHGEPMAMRHLSRYGVPVLPIETGA